jgi:hypothetical protein
MSKLFKNIEAFKQAEGLSDEDIKALLIFCQEKNEYNREPVNIKEFIESPHYLNSLGVIYPKVLQELIEINCGKYSELVASGGIGTAKSTIAIYTQAFQLYLLSCMDNPHKKFGLDPTSEILFVFQNLNKQLAKSVDYDRFRALIESSPYFRNHFKFNKDIKSELQFPNRILVKPVSGEQTAAIGQNVIGGMIDEVNFMEIVANSKKSVDGKTYNQATALYNSLARRRESRFMQGGKLPGILCLVSSKRYPGEFTDVKAEEARTDSTIYVYDKRVWDIKPEGTYSGKTFEVFVGDDARNPFILDEEDVVDEEDGHLIIEVPIEYHKQFNNDLMDALREIGGIALRSVRPFITDVTAIADASGKTKSALTLDEVDFSTQVLKILPKRIKYPEEQRYVHIDLAVSNDHCGIVMGCIPKFVEMDRGGGLIEKLPHIHIDFAINIKPPKNGEIDFGKIRALIYKLREIGVPIKWVSLDSYQSVDMIQRLKQKGFISGTLSIDKEITQYVFCKNALLDRRVAMPEHEKLEKELRELELNEEKGKVDHNPQGSKDISDALAGVIYGLTIKREIWFKHLKSVVEIHEFRKRYMTKLIQQQDSEL